MALSIKSFFLVQGSLDSRKLSAELRLGVTPLWGVDTLWLRGLLQNRGQKHPVLLFLSLIHI